MEGGFKLENAMYSKGELSGISLFLNTKTLDNFDILELGVDGIPGLGMSEKHAIECIKSEMKTGKTKIGKMFTDYNHDRFQYFTIIQSYSTVYIFLIRKEEVVKEIVSWFDAEDQEKLKIRLGFSEIGLSIDGYYLFKRFDLCKWKRQNKSEETAK